MYAVFQTGGKQYRVEKGDVVFVEKLETEEGKKVSFKEVLVLETENGLQVGTPFIKDAEVEAKVLKTGKGKKVRVFTYRPKKDSKRTMGHRQPYTKLEITGFKDASGVIAVAEKEEKTESKKTAAKKPAVAKSEKKVAAPKKEAAPKAEKKVAEKKAAAPKKETAAKKTTKKTTAKEGGEN